MKTRFSLLCLAACVSAASAQSPCGGHGDKSSLLVTTSWLKEHLPDANLTVLFVGQKTDFNSAHIAGSLFLSYNDLQGPRDPEHPLSLEMPAMEQLKDTFQALGVSDNSRVVLYGAKGISPLVTRAFLTLDTMGLGAQTAILDGGFSVWQSEGRSSTEDVPAVKPGKLQLCPQTDTLVDAAFVNGNLRKPGVAIIDARDKQFFTGEAISPNKRPGHIPGAGNLTYSSLTDGDGKINPVEKLRQQFGLAGFHAGDKIVAYCHIGQQATMVYFAARYLGLDARVYDGSWEDWSSRAELPAEVNPGVQIAK